METSVEKAVEHFIEVARSVGMVVRDQITSTNPKVRVVLATKNKAGLRVVWFQTAQVLCLEISQGPPGGDVSGWLVLREILCENGAIPEQEAVEDTFEDALEYGLELMGFAQGGT